jgi:two-component system phosphate regulon response regulator OmpR
MTRQILMIEDDTQLSQMLGEYLAGVGLQLECCETGGQGLARLAEHDYAAVILDLMLPDMDGLDICRQIRSRSTIPVLMLTARGEELDRIIGLEIGADDYLPKPFNPRELLARLRAILRRNEGPAQAPSILSFGALELNLDQRTAHLNGQRCDLTGHQFELLRVLAQTPGRILSRDHLLDQISGARLEPFDRSIDVHISRIRSAIEDDPKQPRRVITVRGQGYMFAREQE